MSQDQDQKEAEKEAKTELAGLSMATSQVQDQKEAVKEAEAEVSNEVKAYDKCYDVMFVRLINSLSRLSDLAMQCGLLSDATQEAVTDLTHVHSQDERTGILLKIVTKKMDKKMGAAPTVMKGFMEAILDVLGEQVHKFLGKYKQQLTDPL